MTRPDLNRTATPRTGSVVAAGAPAAAEAGAEILRRGGSAADAAVATALATCVADPANASLLGRCQVVLRGADGEVQALDGASATPFTLPASIGTGALAMAAIPGLPQALETLHRAHGRLPLSEVAAPAARLARDGIAPPAHLATVWALRARALRETGATPYLDGTRPPATFRHPRLGDLLESFGRTGASALLQGDTAARLVAGVRAQGGHWNLRDLQMNDARPGEVVRGRFRDCEVFTIGAQGWGHSLLEMLGLLDRLPRFGPELSPSEGERLITVIRAGFADRPQRLGSLEPIRDGLALEQLLDPAFLDRRVAQVAEALAAPLPDIRPQRPAAARMQEDQDTTHISTLDSDGACVALTMSIGPHFGLRACDTSYGLLPAKSYRMQFDPTPGARDVTEMSPVIVTRGGRLLAALGGAGSERIPGAVMQVIVNLVDRRMDLAAALAHPRVNVTAARPRVHCDAAPEVIAHLHRRWPDIEVAPVGHEAHLGIVHAVGVDPDGNAAGAADRSWDGRAIRAG